MVKNMVNNGMIVGYTIWLWLTVRFICDHNSWVLRVNTPILIVTIIGLPIEIIIVRYPDNSIINGKLTDFIFNYNDYPNSDHF